MHKPLEVVIVGGGTSGWMSAAAMVGVLNPQVCRVRLIESDEIATVGVGEATLPQMRDFNEAIGIIEPEMMSRSNATFKLSIQFRDWGVKGSTYYHPFGKHGMPMGGIAFHHHWLRALQNGHPYDLDDFCYAAVASRRNLFEFPGKDTSQISSTYNYAYHFDAYLYARHLRGFAEARGVTRTEGKVVDVALNSETGDIASVKLESGEVITGDLFIDCSGFRALLIGKALDVAFEDWNKWLPCDRAWAVSCDRSADFSPYTRSTAREAGWQWRIPLQHRTGCGYVFSSSFIEEDKAVHTLMDNLDGAPQQEPKLIRFRSGRRLASWTRNCVAIGLASGFLEPLESTSIYLVQAAIMNLLRFFPRKPFDPAVRAEFNRLVDIEYDRVRDFLILHYHANSRDDSELWRHCRNMSVPDSLAERLEMFTHRGHIEAYKDGLFPPPSWLAVFLGQGVRPLAYDRLADNMDMGELVTRLDELQGRIAARADAMPTHDAFVADYCLSEGAVRVPQSAGAGA
jgi:tryptophan halogenase